MGVAVGVAVHLPDRLLGRCMQDATKGMLSEEQCKLQMYKCVLAPYPRPNQPVKF